MRILTFLVVLTFCLLSFPAISQNVPQDALDDFKNSFIVDDNEVIKGARISALQPYLSDPEITNLFEQYVTEDDNNAGIIAGDYDIFLGYKPKGPNGCKKNRRWICRMRGEVKN
jgi:hypothetical protein